MRRLWRSVTDGFVPYEAGKPLEALAEDLAIPDLVRLSANESPLGPSPRAVEALRREAARAHLYPDGGSTALRDALAKTLGVGAEQIVCSNGADEKSFPYQSRVNPFSGKDSDVPAFTENRNRIPIGR